MRFSGPLGRSSLVERRRTTGISSSPVCSLRGLRVVGTALEPVRGLADGRDLLDSSAASARTSRFRSSGASLSSTALTRALGSIDWICSIKSCLLRRRPPAPLRVKRMRSSSGSATGGFCFLEDTFFTWPLDSASDWPSDTASDFPPRPAQVPIRLKPCRTAVVSKCPVSSCPPPSNPRLLDW